MVRIAIDCMGGDNSPSAIVKGALDSLKSTADTKLFLFGPEEAVKKELSYAKECGISETELSERVEVMDAAEVITLHESPVTAIRRKKDSSIVKALHFIKEGNADAFISAGSSGAVLAGGQLIVGRAKGVPRPPFGALIPTQKGVTLLLDSGANVDSKPEWLVQYAKMGTIYMREVVGIKNPVVGLVNVGVEEEKGNQLVKETMPLLKEVKDINFKGSCEARDIVFGECDVVICDAFVGNCILKMYEGVGKMLLGEIKSAIKSSPISLLGGALIKGSLKNTLKKFDAKQYGGAPVLGLKGLVVKVHGNTDGREITHAVQQCYDFVKADAVAKIAESIEAETAEKENSTVNP
ncbi:phosphate acyltransferase PlsX [Oribacterium sp. WCC10]|uniref:phosphate acyltransferase PlsX n=1 Tax=Oribacterium sp. WCC10 TaxID=1855343 RepID=UPI0008ED2CC7|nr:phosphate acyltransferase PlsX [Oribacterium sp. WCC10]SFG09077.1 phosphate:acyl-[acyl carrier protein] acyltransferase [Oribacterium sp. WCC10]